MQVLCLENKLNMMARVKENTPEVVHRHLITIHACKTKTFFSVLFFLSWVVNTHLITWITGLSRRCASGLSRLNPDFGNKKRLSWLGRGFSPAAAVRHLQSARVHKRARKQKKSCTNSFRNGSRPRARWPMRLALVRATPRAEVDVIGVQRCERQGNLSMCSTFLIRLLHLTNNRRLQLRQASLLVVYAFFWDS